MSAHRRSRRRVPEEVRQPAVQLRVETSRLTAIPAAGLIRLQEQLALDELTGVLARGAGMSTLTDEMQLVRRSRESQLSLAFVDVDGLKVVNDRGGHAAGDLVLRDVTRVLRVHLRAGDVIFRHGGDEFVCAMPFMRVELAAERLLQAWRSFSERHCCSFSAGFAELRPDDDAASLIARADDCLHAGRPRSQGRDWRRAT